MEILAIALTLLWLSAPDQLRHGCYALIALILIVVLLAAFFGWPIAAGVAAVAIVKVLSDAWSQPP